MASRSLCSLCGLFLLLVAFSGCANLIHQRTYWNYLDQGERAFDEGNLAAAEEAYRRALINVQLGHLSDEAAATALYNLGRTKRFLCKDAEAEQLLRESIETGGKEVGPDHPRMAARYLELARLYYDQERYKETVPFIEKGLPIVEKLNIENTHPAVYAYTLDQYAVGLRKTGRENDAQSIVAKVKAIRERADLTREWEQQRWLYQRECKVPKK